MIFGVRSVLEGDFFFFRRRGGGNGSMNKLHVE